MPWRWLLHARGPNPEAGRRAEVAMHRLDRLADDLKLSIARLERLAERLEVPDDDHPSPA